MLDGGLKMKNIKFKYRNADTHYRWVFDEMITGSVQELIDTYSESKDFEYKLLEIKDLDTNIVEMKAKDVVLYEIKESGNSAYIALYRIYNYNFKKRHLLGYYSLLSEARKSIWNDVYARNYNENDFSIAIRCKKYFNLNFTVKDITLGELLNEKNRKSTKAIAVAKSTENRVGQ